MSRIVRAGQARAMSRLPLIGSVRVGEKRESKKTGKEYPVSLDYFKATGDYAGKFYEVYPEKPTKIQVIFVSDDDWQSCFEEWDGRDGQGRKAGYSDGQTYYLWNGKEYKETGSKQEVTEYSNEHGIKWKPVLTLHFVIPAIRGVFGCWRFTTSGNRSSMNAIRDVYDEIKAQAGTVVNIPFDLTVKKVQSNKPGVQSVYPVVTLVPNISQENMEVLREYLTAGTDVKRLGMLTDEKLKGLPQRADDVMTLSPGEMRAFEQEDEKVEEPAVDDAVEPCYFCGQEYPVDQLTSFPDYPLGNERITIKVCGDRGCREMLKP